MRDVVARVNGGQLYLYDARSGGFVKMLNTTVGKYVSAVVSGGVVQAQRADGKTDIYDTETGRFVRTIG